MRRPHTGLTLRADDWQVIDGDTVQCFAVGNRFQPVIRSIGVDCPELNTPQGKDAAKAARQLLTEAEHIFFHIPAPRDVGRTILQQLTFGRFPGYIFISDNETLGERLVRMGHATKV